MKREPDFWSWFLLKAYIPSKTIRTLLEETFTLQGATRGKTAKTAVLPEFCKVERGGGSGGPWAAAAVVCLSCLPKSTLAALF